ncbi:MAG: lipid-A-disaccharide synthase [Clostridiales bacterium]|nr:lipid-A-disaccharide synthase [Clostridiales bacterium]
MNSFLIVAGENSGEKYGADVVREFKKRDASASFFGIGGPRMQEAGVEVIFGVEELSAIGLFEVFSSLARIRRIFRGLEREIGARRPLAAVLIDSPDFNLRLAKGLKRQAIPVLYYISPTVWAWRSGRLKTIKRTVEKMLLIFPFEKAIYDAHGIPARFVGHPLMHKIRTQMSRAEFIKKYFLPTDAKIITLLPGSRKTEVKHHLPALTEATRRIRSDFNVAFLWVVAECLEPGWVERLRASADDRDRVLTEDAYEAMAFSDLVLSACGTANLEAALLGTPLIAFYRLSPLTYYPFRRLVKIRDYSIVNILAGKRIIPELIQGRFTAERLALETSRLLQSDEKRAEMKAEFLKLRRLLGDDNAPANVARELEKLVFGQTA